MMRIILNLKVKEIHPSIIQNYSSIQMNVLGVVSVKGYVPQTLFLYKKYLNWRSQFNCDLYVTDLMLYY